jgi:hypothetical protein
VKRTIISTAAAVAVGVLYVRALLSARARRQCERQVWARAGAR